MSRSTRIPIHFVAAISCAAWLATSAGADVTPIVFANRVVLPSVGRVAAIAELDGSLGAEIVWSPDASGAGTEFSAPTRYSNGPNVPPPSAGIA